MTDPTSASDTEAQLRAIMQLGMPPGTVEALSLLSGLGGPFAQIAAVRDQYEELVTTAATSHDTLSGRGWGVVNMPTTELAEATALARAGGGDTADALLAELWDNDSRTSRVVARVGALGAVDPHMRAMSGHRRRLLVKARDHHRSGAYEASVMLVLAQVEGITADATEGLMFFSKHPKRAADIEDPSRLVSIPAGLPAVRLPYIVDVSATQAEGSLSRHGLLHGRELAYDTKVTSAKVWSLLDAVVEWALPLVDAIAKQRVDDRRAQRAGSDDVNAAGQRLDDREFPETRAALRWLSTVQMGQHRNHSRFHANVLTGWLSSKDFTRRNLPEDHGIRSHVSGDGQVWWAWRTTVSGWVLGIAYVVEGDSFIEFLYAGPEAPSASPADDPEAWGERWGLPPDWESLAED